VRSVERSECYVTKSFHSLAQEALVSRKFIESNVRNESRLIIFAVRSAAAGLMRAAAIFGHRPLVLILLLAGMGIARPVTLMAQSDNSSIAGVITDPSGALVDHATITVTSELTGAEHKALSNHSGFYTIAGLAPGKYTVTVVARGFRTVTMTNNNLDPSVLLPSTSRLSLARRTSR
jgi:hypothetical protein